MPRFATVFIAALLAATAQAAWYPIFRPSYIHVRPGEAVTVVAGGGWLSGIMLVPFVPMTFISEDPLQLRMVSSRQRHPRRCASPACNRA